MILMRFARGPRTKFQLDSCGRVTRPGLDWGIGDDQLVVIFTGDTQIRLQATRAQITLKDRTDDLLYPSGKPAAHRAGDFLHLTH